MSLDRREFLGAMAAGLGVATSGPLLSRVLSPGAKWVAPAPGRAANEWLSHRPMRPLPVASRRAIDESSRAYFLSPDGRDANDGRSEGRAWKTLRGAARRMTPGATLYLAGGHYWLDSGHVFDQSGTARSPMTIRALPDQLVILDCGYREFFESPDTAWEPCPASQGGVEGEYWSTRTYPLGRESRVVGGNFGDSMVPLFRYASMFDLRSLNEFSVPELANNNYDDTTGIYCGPGAMWNSATGRIHIRLAHTHIPQLSQTDYLNHGPGFDHNYTGETDPRKIPLVLHQNVEIGFRCSHVRVQDLVFQGQKRVEFGDTRGVGVEMDGIHVFAGPQPFGILVPGSGSLINSKIRGYDAPWSNRFNDKNRTSHGRLVQLVGERHEVAHCEFTDHHDGVAMNEPNLTVDFHHNLVENMNDDGLFLNPRHATRTVRIWQNHFAGAVSYLAFSGGGRAAVSPDDVGCYVYRNFFDLRRMTYGNPPRRERPGADVFRVGLLTNEHSDGVRPNLFFYHNDIALPDGRNQDWYLARLGNDYRGATFQVHNNILVQVIGRTKEAVREASPGTFEANTNLLWGVRDGSERRRAGDLYDDPRFVRFTADWRDGTDLHLQAGSPAIDAGTPLPSDWPDSLRDLDEGPPDVGAIPYGVAGTVFGPHADH